MNFSLKQSACDGEEKENELQMEGHVLFTTRGGAACWLTQSSQPSKVEGRNTK